MSPSLPDTRLLADIGGTNARFAWQVGPGGALQDVLTLPAAEFDTLEAAVRAYLARVPALGRTPPVRCAIGIANPVSGDHVQMTNHHWSFSIEALRRTLAWQELVVINDFTALALAIPLLQPHERRLMAVGPQQADAGKAIGVLGAGTGLGMGGLLPLSLPGGTRHWAPIEGEGGHISLAPDTPLEHDVLRVLQQRFGRVSAERVLSGPGLLNLLDAIEQVHGQRANLTAGPQHRTAADIVQAGLDARCPVCAQTLATFCAWLGSVAGDLALLLGARGGVYIGGGIVPRLGTWFDASGFRARFDDKGRLSGLVQQVPVYVIHAEVSPALRGVSQALR